MEVDSFAAETPATSPPPASPMAPFSNPAKETPTEKYFDSERPVKKQANPEPSSQLENASPSPTLHTQVSSLGDRSGFVSLVNRCSSTCNLCGPLGCLNEDERSLQSLEIRLKSIRAAGLSSATFPPNTVLYKQKESIFGLCRELHLEPVLRVSAAFGLKPHQSFLLEWIHGGGSIEAAYDRVWTEGDLEFLRQLNGRLGPKLTICVVPTHSERVEVLLDSLPANLASRAEFLFPLKINDRDLFLSCDEIHETLRELRLNRTEFVIRPYRGIDLIDGSCSPQAETEPDFVPALKNSSLTPAPEISVIVPTFNRLNMVINTLRHLQRQTMDAEKFEVIIVDDGSDDGTLEKVRAHLTRTPSRFNLKYLVFPRHDANTTTAFQEYRSGIARNLGVKHAAGKILMFLDSDILVPTDLLADLREQHQLADIIQYQQVQIPFKKGAQRPRYQELDIRKHSVKSENGYWEKFYSQPDWQSLKMRWRYFSTACLSIKREHFLACGGFARGFHSYGFEDTLLGWQLSRLAGLRWMVRHKPVFHLLSSDETSPHRNSLIRRRTMMARSAKTFYHATLDEEFYQFYFPLLGQQIRMRTLIRFLSRRLIGRALLSLLYGLLLIWREPQKVDSFFRDLVTLGKTMAERSQAQTTKICGFIRTIFLKKKNSDAETSLVKSDVSGGDHEIQKITQDIVTPPADDSYLTPAAPFPSVTTGATEIKGNA